MKLDHQTTRSTVKIKATAAAVGTHVCTLKARVRLVDQDMELTRPLTIQIVAPPAPETPPEPSPQTPPPPEGDATADENAESPAEAASE